MIPEWNNKISQALELWKDTVKEIPTSYEGLPEVIGARQKIKGYPIVEEFLNMPLPEETRSISVNVLVQDSDPVHTTLQDVLGQHYTPQKTNERYAFKFTLQPNKPSPQDKRSACVRCLEKIESVVIGSDRYFLDREGDKSYDLPVLTVNPLGDVFGVSVNAKFHFKPEQITEISISTRNPTRYEISKQQGLIVQLRVID